MVVEERPIVPRDDIINYYRTIEDKKDRQIETLSTRIKLRDGYVDAADQTQDTLRNEAKRWEQKYTQLLFDYESYRRGIEESKLSLPVAQREINLLNDKLKDSERDVDMKNVEIKVLQNKYNILREDYSNIRLKQMADRKLDADADSDPKTLHHFRISPSSDRKAM